MFRFFKENMFVILKHILYIYSATPTAGLTCRIKCFILKFTILYCTVRVIFYFYLCDIFLLCLSIAIVLTSKNNISTSHNNNDTLYFLIIV